MGNDLPEGVVNAEPSGGWESGDAADPETTDAETTDAEAADAEATDGSSESAVEGGIRYTPEDAQADAAASGAGAVTVPDQFVESAEIQAGMDPDLQTDAQSES
ncbi:hypothetical protein [Microbacterium aurum]|jgi:hypothetical protein